MNRKERRASQSINKTSPEISFAGATYTIENAVALALQYQQKKEHKQAIEIYRRILEKSPTHTQSMNNLGLLLYHFGDINEAIPLYRRALHLNPNFYAYNNLGTALLSQGNVAEAGTLFIKALELNPRCAAAWHALTQMRTYDSPNHPHIDQVKALLNRPDPLPGHERLYFCLGKIYDDLGVYDEAFRYYRQANELCSQSVIYHAQATIDEFNAIREVFSREFLAQPFSFASPSRTPIFIVGMPRSGTTLLANVLSKHPLIRAAGELVDMIECAQSVPAMIGGNITYPHAIRHITPEIAMPLIAAYRKRLRLGIAPDVRHVIDKHPINFKYLGFIAMLFPQAKIIHCTREPLDIGLSNYFQYFDPDYSYSFNLKNIGHYYRQYDRLMEHWRHALPMKMLEVSYEDTVTDMERVVRQMLEFLELEWNEDCLAPHTNKRVVKTASMCQVRRPVYQQSVGRWRHYEKYLEPLKAGLAA